MKKKCHHIQKQQILDCYYQRICISRASLLPVDLVERHLKKICSGCMDKTNKRLPHFSDFQYDSQFCTSLCRHLLEDLLFIFKSCENFCKQVPPSISHTDVTPLMSFLFSFSTLGKQAFSCFSPSRSDSQLQQAQVHR